MISVGLVFLVGLLWNGWCYIPDGALEQMAWQAADPWLDIGQNTCHQERPLWLLLCGWLGANTVPGYSLFSGMVNVLAVCVAAGGAWWAWGRRWALLVLVSPISYVLTTWVGLEDGLTVILTSVMMWATPLPVIALVAALAAMTHPAAMLAGLAILLLRRQWNGRVPVGSWLPIMAWGLGTILGTSIALSLAPAGFVADTRLGQIMGKTPLAWLIISTNNLPMALWSFAFVLWVPLVWAVWRYWVLAPRFYTLVLLYAGLALEITACTLDTTRVFALLMWGPMLLALRRAEELAVLPGPDEQYRWCLCACGWVGILVPHVAVWSGRVISIPFAEVLR